MCAREKARKTGGCQRRTPRAFSNGANSREEVENEQREGPSRNSRHREEPMPQLLEDPLDHILPLATAATGKNRCHVVASGVVRLSRSSQQPPQGRTDATGPSATSCGPRTGSRNSRHREEPMPHRRVPRCPPPPQARNSRHQEEPMPRMPRIGCMSQGSSRNSRHQEEPMPREQTRLNAVLRRILAPASASKNRCHVRQGMTHTIRTR